VTGEQLDPARKRADEPAPEINELTIEVE